MSLKDAHLIFYFFPLIVLGISKPVYAGKYESALEENVNYSEVCKVYLENLNQNQDDPYGMACERKLNPKLGFSRPKWRSLDPVKYADLIRDIYHFRRWDGSHVISNAEIKNRSDEKRLTLEITKVDLDQDGVLDNLVRLGSGSGCNAKNRLEHAMTFDHKGLFKANNELNKVDTYTRYMSGLDDVFLYKNTVYTDMFYGKTEFLRKQAGYDAELYVEQFSRYGDGQICKYLFYKSK